MAGNNDTYEKADRRRQRVIRQLESIISYVNDFDDSSDIGRSQLEHRYGKVQELQAEFELIQNKIEDFFNCEEQFNIRSEVDGKIYEILARMSVKMASTENKISQESHGSISRGTSNRRVKLPIIPLPSFDGRYDEWLTFRDTFRSMIHDNSDIDEIEKFHHLRAALKGEAAKVIMSLETTEHNYSIAWNSICQRYQNRRLIVSTHVSELFKLPLQKTETAKGLRELVNSLNSHVRSLSSLGQPTDKWDAVLVHLVTSKVNATTVREWECTRIDDEPPKLDELRDFLNKRCLILESVEATGRVKSNSGEENHVKTREPDNKRRQWAKAFTSANKETPPSKKRQINNLQVTTKQSSCPICKGNHWVQRCEQLIAATTEERINRIREAKLCLNCLRPGHYAASCIKGSCKFCGKHHNTLIHRNDNIGNPSKIVANVAKTKLETVLLSTAMVRVKNIQSGQTWMARALLDSGSMSNFMTENLANKLQLVREHTRFSVMGIGNSLNRATSRVHCELQATSNEYKANTACVVLKNITDQLPVTRVPLKSVPIPCQIKLADPKFNEPSHIDLLLGAELFFKLLKKEQITISQSVILQNTVFGWVLAGSVKTNESTESNVQCFTAITERDEDLSILLRKFWELEEANSTRTRNPETTACEQIYRETTTRDETGRYTVNLPLRNDIIGKIGDTKAMSIRRFHALEKRLESCPEIKQTYTQFIQEYEALGHMKEEIQSPEGTIPEVYLPHHCVIKADSSTTKLRVVYDASAKSTTGVSLNQAMLSGPTIQDDLFDILIRFRLHRYVLTGDIEKMYRQIKMYEPHQQLQKIIWRNHPSESLKTYVLTTVTYGTAAAPYLAVRTLHQLAEDEEIDFPKAAQTLKSDFYVDDLLTGTDTLTEAIQLQRDIAKLCSKGGFLLRKWCSNHPDLLHHLAEEQKANIQELNFSNSSITKTLGVNWIPASDSLHFNVKEWEIPKRLSKRTVISEIAKLFDPLGLVGPIVIIAKIFIQSLWRLSIGWDDPLPPEYMEQWINYRQGLKMINQITVPRRTIDGINHSIQVHVFCDASELAYGTCIYLRSSGNNLSNHCQLVCSKSRVAPLKHTTIPRLELCAALLGARLLDKVKTAIKTVVQIDKCFLWSDSTVALAWISDQQGSRSWKTFIANRVAEIHDRTAGHQWLYIKGIDNPADIISRGLTAKQLIGNRLWFCGPDWLMQPERSWLKPEMPQIKEPIPERRAMQVNLTTVNVNDDPILDRFSRLERLQRVTAYILRFVKNCKLKGTEKGTGALTVSELQQGLDVWIRKVQKAAFPNEIEDLKNGQPVGKKSRLKTLHPILDASGILRVGGRIQNAFISYEEKHPILIAHDRFARLLVGSEHRRLMHAGPSQMRASLRQRYWIFGDRNLTKQEFQNCGKCFRWRTKAATQLMGSLPAARVNPSPAFSVCGVDYAGPFKLRVGTPRSRTTTKAYVALFVCFATRAAHLELVSDLTTEAFLATFRRFIARRGKPIEVNSDNGTNFVGADNQLNQFLQLSKNSITENAAQQGIRWKFIPAHAPHFGGLWEGGVKATKYHIRRVVGQTILSFEEFATILAQMEAILNSRPLCEQSDDPQDLQSLTPGHFLIGRSLTTFPEPNHTEAKAWKTRWQMLQAMIQHFWHQWQAEYLHQLQQRTKWTKPQKSMHPGELVIIVEDNQPPLTWKLGRIEEVHPGQDGRVRVATLRTQDGTIRRPIVRLRRLPIVERGEVTSSTGGGMSANAVGRTGGGGPAED